MRHVASVTGILLIAGLVFGLTACDQEVDRSVTVFTVDGMHCDACSTSIVTALEKIDGVEEASADHELGIAEAVYRPREVEVDELKVEIEKLGYTVKGMETGTIDS